MRSPAPKERPTHRPVLRLQHRMQPAWRGCCCAGQAVVPPVGRVSYRRRTFCGSALMWREDENLSKQICAVRSSDGFSILSWENGNNSGVWPLAPAAVVTVTVGLAKWIRLKSSCCCCCWSLFSHTGFFPGDGGCNQSDCCFFSANKQVETPVWVWWREFL